MVLAVEVVVVFCVRGTLVNWNQRPDEACCKALKKRLSCSCRTKWPFPQSFSLTATLIASASFSAMVKCHLQHQKDWRSCVRSAVHD